MKQKTILLELLRWLCAGLAVVFLVVSFRQEPVSSAAFEDVASAVTASIDLSALQEGSVQMVKRLYGLNPSDFDGCLLYYPQTNMEAEELLLLKLGREEEVFRQPPQEFNALTQSRKQGRKGLGGRFQRFQPTADGEERAAKVVKNVEHHALAGLGLGGQLFCPLCHPGVQLPSQLLGAVEEESKPPADEHHAADGKGKVVEAGAAQQVEGDRLHKKHAVQPGHQRPDPEAGGDSTGQEHQSGTLIVCVYGGH